MLGKGILKNDTRVIPSELLHFDWLFFKITWKTSYLENLFVHLWTGAQKLKPLSFRYGFIYP